MYSLGSLSIYSLACCRLLGENTLPQIANICHKKHPGGERYALANLFEPSYTPRTTKLLGGILVSLRPSVCPSVRPSRVRPASRVRSVASTVLVGSISYLYIL